MLAFLYLYFHEQQLQQLCPVLEMYEYEQSPFVSVWPGLCYLENKDKKKYWHFLELYFLIS